MTDQQSADIMSCQIGTEYINTPAMDKLAREGIFFTNAYTANPLCMPARNSIFSGSYPHQTGCQNNGQGELDTAEFPGMGTYFKKAGYDTGYVGKWHLWYDAEDKEGHGFEMTAVLKSPGYDDDMPEPAISFMQKERQKPFLLVVSFCNPHDVCQLARHGELPSGPLPPLPPLDQRPPLKENMAPAENESDAMSLIRKSYHSQKWIGVGNYDEDKWRRLRWGYYRLVERVDALIGQVLDGLERSGQKDNTLVIFTSDHGESHGAHGFNQKTVFYEESARVPLILSHANLVKDGTSEVLANSCVDILPTMLDLAAIERPEGLPGRSLKTAARGEDPQEWRDYVVSENFITQGGPVDGVTPMIKGRMVRSKTHKYCLFDHGEKREELFDMKTDRLETVNLAAQADCSTIVEQHRSYLEEFARKHQDETALAMLRAGIRDSSVETG